MVTTNIDVDDGIVNEATGILRHVEDLPNDDEIRDFRAWLEFADSRIGAKVRLKMRHMTVGQFATIDANWTPISRKAANIQITNTIRCKRSQIPLTPGCAVTVHKSQGGTYDRAVIKYDRSQQNQLVYVALSRTTNIERTYFTNPRDDFTFYHKFGSSAPSILEIRDEYNRLCHHTLETITGRVKTFKETALEGCSNLIICTINAQSIVAHSSDIETDEMLIDSDVLALTETWMDSENIVTINGFELISTSNLSVQPSPSSSTVAPSNARRTAGGVAIYPNLTRS